MNSGSNLKRQRLRVLVKLMLGIGVVTVIYVAFVSGFSGAGRMPDVPSMKVAIGDIEPGQIKQLLWENRPIIILHRSAEQVRMLAGEAQFLADPLSSKSVQPDFALNHYRSISPQWLVVLASGTDLGCSLNFLPDYQLDRGAAAIGAFQDSCRGSLYDLAGRVLLNQAAAKNLVIPPYRLEGDSVFLGVSASNISSGG